MAEETNSDWEDLDDVRKVSAKSPPPPVEPSGTADEDAQDNAGGSQIDDQNDDKQDDAEYNDNYSEIQGAEQDKNSQHMTVTQTFITADGANDDGGDDDEDFILVENRDKSLFASPGEDELDKILAESDAKKKKKKAEAEKESPKEEKKEVEPPILYMRSTLQHDTHLFINRHLINLTSPITPEMIEREELLYGCGEPRAKLGILEDLKPLRRRSPSPVIRSRRSYSPPKRSRSQSPVKSFTRADSPETLSLDKITTLTPPKPILKKHNKLSRSELKLLTVESDDEILKPLPPPRFTWIPPPRYMYPFSYWYRYRPRFWFFDDRFDLEMEAFELELELTKLRRERQYISPLRLSKHYESTNSYKSNDRKIDLPPKKSVKRNPAPYVPYTPRKERYLSEIERRVEKLNSRAECLNSQIRRLKSIWDY